VPFQEPITRCVLCIYNHELNSLREISKQVLFFPLTRVFIRCENSTVRCNSTKANMSWYQTLDPSNSFYEEVRVGRNGNGYHDVTIYYTVYQRGRGGSEECFNGAFSAILTLKFFGIKISNIRLLSIFYQSSVSQMEARLSRKRQTEQVGNLKLRRDTETDLLSPVIAEMEVCVFLPVPFL